VRAFSAFLQRDVILGDFECVRTCVGYLGEEKRGEGVGRLYPSKKEEKLVKIRYAEWTGGFFDRPQRRRNPANLLLGEPKESPFLH